VRYFFTSDTHFGHARIVELSHRPFRDVRQMNEELVRRWNARVTDEDAVFHLGDFAMGPRHVAGDALRQLHGHKILIKGNHDRTVTAMTALGFDEVYPDFYTVMEGREIYMRHVPDPRFYGEDGDVHPKIDDPQTCVHLHGHVHESWVRRGRAFNVGVDVREFAPVTLQEILADDRQEYLER
jgi:calcineurin-like phosphoesterase family protein